MIEYYRHFLSTYFLLILQRSSQCILQPQLTGQSNIVVNNKILKVLHIRNIQPKLKRINFESSANVLKCLEQLTLSIETNFKK